MRREWGRGKEALGVWYSQYLKSGKRKRSEGRTPRIKREEHLKEKL